MIASTLSARRASSRTRRAALGASAAATALLWGAQAHALPQGFVLQGGTASSSINGANTVETVDQPTKGEILAFARKFFEAKDRTTPQLNTPA